MNNHIYFESKEFLEVLNKARCFAATDWPVLLMGETGVGKEVIARELHLASTRKLSTFVPVNCSAIPAGLFESELFGHERGAFSGAVHGFRGLARAAAGGSLFLDEIGELDISLQAKILRLVELGEVRSVGSRAVTEENVRIIAATNVDLSSAVAEGNFRLDLLERLSVLVIRIPPLRERPGDVRALVNGFSQSFGLSVCSETIEELSQFSWPGNTRQLKNVLIRAGVLGGGNPTHRLFCELLSEENAKTLRPATYERAPLAEIEKHVIVDRLRRNGGNRKKTAYDLGLAKSTLHEKLRRWHVPGDDHCLGTA